MTQDEYQARDEAKCQEKLEKECHEAECQEKEYQEALLRHAKMARLDKEDHQRMARLKKEHENKVQEEAAQAEYERPSGPAKTRHLCRIRTPPPMPPHWAPLGES